jgi:tetratricopeptide (TPR) repeat protein
VSELQEVQEAEQRRSEGNYDRAVQLLVRADTAYPENAELEELLARTYYEWGTSLVDNSNGQVSQLTLALEKFASGLVVAPPESPVFQELQQSDDSIRSYIKAITEQEALQAKLASASLDLPTRQAETERVAELFTSLNAKQPGLPGFGQRYAQALFEAGKSYSEGGDDKEQQIDLRTKARAYCEQAIEVDPTLAEAQTCVDDSGAAIAFLNATPTNTPSPTRPPPPPPTVASRLVIGKINEDERPGCISVQIRGINASGWILSINGLNLRSTFDGGGNSALCGLPENAVTFTIFYGNGTPVPGGSGIPAKGRDIFVGNWR